MASLRPEKVAILRNGAKPGPEAIEVEGIVRQVLYQGAVRRIELATQGGRLVVALPASAGAAPEAGERVRAAFSQEALHPMEEG